MAAVDEAQKRAAAKALARGRNQARAALEGRVDRSTVTRWMDDTTFIQLIEEYRADPEAIAERYDLESLVPDAHILLASALRGEKVPVGQARIALEVLKAAASLTPAGTNQTTQLAERLAQLEGMDFEAD